MVLNQIPPRGARSIVLAQCAVAMLSLVAAGRAAETGDPSKASLADLSPEELMQIEVTSAARKDQKLLQVAAAAYVITADDIRRSGATTIPEALRVVPGLQVAQIDSNTWAVSARGFNGRGSNKILVLIDGRSIYNSLYSGTFWDQNQVPLDDIERIEVIRGPGGTMWGANAVNGVINIITRKASDTQGVRVTAEAGVSDLPDTGIRYGGTRGDHLQYRAYTRFARRPEMLTAEGHAAVDRWHSIFGGARLDWQPSARDSVTLDGDIQQGDGHSSVNPVFPLPSALSATEPFDLSGGHIQAHWSRQLTRSDFAIQVFYSQESRSEMIARGTLATLNFDFQHHFRWGGHQDLMWGLDYRWRRNRIRGPMQHPLYRDNLLGFFLQDEISLFPDRLTLTVGAKLEGTSKYSLNRLEVQPQLRLLWTPDRRQSVWTSASRAVRTPSQFENDALIAAPLPPQSGIPVTALLVGNPDAPSEVLLAYEAGYRRQVLKRITVDIAGFYNHYSRFLMTLPGVPYMTFSPAPALFFPQTFGAAARGNTGGVEIAASWTPVRSWRLQVSDAWMDADVSSSVSQLLPQPPGALWATPRTTLDFRSSWDMTRRLSLDSSVYFASRIMEPAAPSYARVDLNIRRGVGEFGELTAGVHNLFDDRHLEFVSEDYTRSTWIRRNFFVKMAWSF